MTKKTAALITVSHGLCWAAVILVAAALGAPKELTALFLPGLAVAALFAINQRFCNDRVS